jgi:hypothetical protein
VVVRLNHEDCLLQTKVLLVECLELVISLYSSAVLNSGKNSMTERQLAENCRVQQAIHLLTVELSASLEGIQVVLPSASALAAAVSDSTTTLSKRKMKKLASESRKAGGGMDVEGDDDEDEDDEDEDDDGDSNTEFADRKASAKSAAVAEEEAKKAADTRANLRRLGLCKVKNTLFFLSFLFSFPFRLHC